MGKGWRYGNKGFFCVCVNNFLSCVLGKFCDYFIVDGFVVLVEVGGWWGCELGSGCVC